MRLLRVIFAILVSLPLAACALSGDAVKGRVLEEGTHKPIPGAIVVVRWQGRVSSFVDSQGVCYHVETATTDEQGNYQTKAWSQKQDYSVKFDHLSVDAYKPGYGLPGRPSQVSEIARLAPFKGTRGERLEYLKNMIGNECGAREDYAQKLIPLYRSLYEEARSISVTKEDKKVVRTLHYSIDRLELGNDEADKKLFGREYEE